LTKQDGILEEFSRARLNEEAVNVERIYFYKTDKRVNSKQEEPFQAFSGCLPVLLSAPHAVRYYRQKKVKASDQFTGAIVYLLNRLTGCHAIAATKLYGGDPEIDDPCIYKAKISEICSRNKVKMVIDLHGAARDQNFDVNLNTNNRNTLLGKVKIQEILVRNFQAYGLGRVSQNQSSDTGPHSVITYVAHDLGIPSVQLEINKHYRVPGKNSQGFHRLLGALTDSIQEFK
jgi:hypothetical protein